MEGINMLVLTRKVGEEIVIADNIRITVVEVGPGRVKIGITAPQDVRIDRDEVRAKKEGQPALAPLARVSRPTVPYGRTYRRRPR